MRRLRIAAVAASVVAMAGAGASSASAATPRSFYGIVQFTPLGAGDFARMGGAKVGTLRIAMAWPSIQHSQGGPFDFAATDNVVAGAAAQGVEILPTLAGTPPFIAGCTGVSCSRHIVTSPSALKAWQAFVKAVADRYGTHGTFWKQFPSVPYHPFKNYQFWNEQNNTSQHNTPRAYTKLVKSGDKALHSVDKKAKVVLGGMFGTPPNNAKNDAWNYLKSMYKAHARRFFDGVALHPYAVKPSGLKDPIKQMRKAMKKGGDKKKKLYITEIGWGSSKKKHPGTGGRGALFNVNPKKQAKYLKDSFKTLTSHRRSWKIGGVFWFTWKDPLNPPDGLCAFCYSAGLLKANGTTAKPSLGAFKSFTRKTKGKHQPAVALPDALRPAPLVPPSYRRAELGLL